MIIKDFNLKFANKEELDNLFAQCGLIVEGEYFLSSESHSLLVIGEIWKPSNVFDTIQDSEGNILQIERTIKVEGYHANLRLVDMEIPNNLLPYIINPITPTHKWL